MHNQYIVTFHRQTRKQGGHLLILRMSVDGTSTMYSAASWVIYVLIGCRDPFIRFWQPLLAESTAKCSLLHPENECQCNVNICTLCIFGNQGIARIFVLIKEVLTALIGKCTIYRSLNRDSQLMNLANCKACKTYYWLLKTRF